MERESAQQIYIYIYLSLSLLCALSINTYPKQRIACSESGCSGIAVVRSANLLPESHIGGSEPAEVYRSI